MALWLTGPSQAVVQTTGNVQINLPYDYTDVLPSATAFDAYAQTMYMVLYNSFIPGSQCVPHPHLLYLGMRHFH